MSKSTKKETPVYRFPGRKQLQLFLIKNSKLFNFSQIERDCDFGKDTLRYVCRGQRELTNEQYKKVQEVLLPKLCEFVFLLQNYKNTVEIEQKDIYNWD